MTDDSLFKLAEHLHKLEYPEQLEWCLRELVESVLGGESVKMACALAKQSTTSSDQEKDSGDEQIKGSE